MEKLSEALQGIPQKWESTYKPMTEKEKVEFLVDIMNKDKGDLDSSIYDCKKCKNKGIIYYAEPTAGEHYREVARDCECKAIRKSVKEMKRSGLEPIIKRCTFDRYKTTEEWQRNIKEKAQYFAKNCETLTDKCFFVGGAIGSGKTHICTAIVRELLIKGKSARYMLWINDSTKLKAIVNEPEYAPMLKEVREAEVLYIDDFFKIAKDRNGNELYPSAADLRLAYEIIDYRYQNKNLITIISSERFIPELVEIDFALGSRIYEMSNDGENVINIAREKKRNYRLRNMQVI